jgi:hypothetical protein
MKNGRDIARLEKVQRTKKVQIQPSPGGSR